MSNEWTINNVQGGTSGNLLDRCQIRKNDDGTVDFLGVLATATGEGSTCNFPPFAYQGLIWNLSVNSFDYGPRCDEVEGGWNNNAPKPPGQDDGTYTGQAGSGGVGDVGGEDAASASA